MANAGTVPASIISLSENVLPSSSVSKSTLAMSVEKEIVFIIVDNEIKDDVMLEIYKVAGLETKGMGICFSMNVDDCVGLTPFENEENKE